MNRQIAERLARLRAAMAKKHIDYCLIPTADYHNSEYVAEHFKTREYFCGFTGSNGTLVVANDMAGLWTDGRYFIQADRELEGTGVELFRMADEGVPTINEFLSERMNPGETLGFDGRVVSAALGRGLERDLAGKGVSFIYDFDPAALAWTDRPPLPVHELFVIGDEYAGKNVSEKLSEVRGELAEKKADALMLSSLDDICWLYNIRGNDVECSPVALSYTWVTADRAVLFIQTAELTDAVRLHLEKAGVEIREYGELIGFLGEDENKNSSVLFDPNRTGYGIMKMLSEGDENREEASPTLLLKAVKNSTELENIRRVYLEDSAALCRFIYWVKMNAGRIPMTEMSAGSELDAMRAKLPGFIELSFPTICAYGANAAMMHYEATEDHNAVIERKGMLLVDSGGTYMGGTTDVTRTIVLGDPGPEIKKHYTAVTAGMLRLANASFLKGCTGRNLDILARGPVWDLDMDYKCGTGHGVGYILNVHEGPHNIRWRKVDGEKEAELLPGMIVSDEPGVYIENSHGIRVENILEVTEGAKNGDGQFLHFSHLTWAPIDLDGIEPSLLQPRELEWLNSYHAAVYEKVSPLIEDKEIREWLKNATAAVSLE